MGLLYHDRQRKNARISTKSLQDSVTKTATFTGAAVEVGDASTLRASLSVTAHAGTTPTLDVKVQTSHDGSTNWTECTANGAATAAFAQVTTANGTTSLIVTGLDRFVRVVATIGGTTPSYTYSVSAEAV